MRKLIAHVSIAELTVQSSLSYLNCDFVSNCKLTPNLNKLIFNDYFKHVWRCDNKNPEKYLTKSSFIWNSAVLTYTLVFFQKYLFANF